jgi:hypothetical protein
MRESFTARAENDGRILCIALEHKPYAMLCYDFAGVPFRGYVTEIIVADGAAVTEAAAMIDVDDARANCGAIYANVGEVLRGLGVEIPQGWRAGLVPQGLHYES